MNERRSRITIFSIDVVQKNVIENAANHFHKTPNLHKKHLDGSPVRRIQADSFEEV